MSKIIGISAGEWNSGTKMYSNTNFNNATGEFFSLALTRGNPRGARSRMGTLEFLNRKKIYLKLTKEGFNDAQLNSFWNKWQIRGNTKSNGFEAFVKQQQNISNKLLENENKILAQIEEDNKNEIIKDIEVITSTVGATTPETNVVTSSSMVKKPNYLLFGGVGIVVLLIGYIIIKKIK